MYAIASHSHTAGRSDHTEQGWKSPRTRSREQGSQSCPGRHSVCTLHASLTASPALPCKLIPSAKQHRTPFFFFFSLFLFSLKLNPLVAFGNEWIAELISFLKKKMLVPHRQTHAVHCTGSDTPLLRRGRPGAGGPWTSLTQTCRLTGSGAVLRVSRLRSAQSWTGARSQQLCHCSVFRKG